MSKYPEHEKLSAISDKSQAIGEFLEWLRYQRGYRICTHIGEGDFAPISGTVESLLADYFGIDTAKIDDEKRAMLDELRAASGKS